MARPLPVLDSGIKLTFHWVMIDHPRDSPLRIIQLIASRLFKQISFFSKFNEISSIKRFHSHLASEQKVDHSKKNVDRKNFAKMILFGKKLGNLTKIITISINLFLFFLPFFWHEESEVIENVIKLVLLLYYSQRELVIQCSPILHPWKMFGYQVRSGA